MKGGPLMSYISLFFGTFTTLLAIINPLEALPVFLGFLEGRDEGAQKDLARRACTYAALLCLFFLVFGAVVLKLFDVPLCMVRIVGGIILVRLGFSLFQGPGAEGPAPSAGPKDGDPAFVPLAMPLMAGPGALATVLGMSTVGDHSLAGRAVTTAIVAGAVVATLFATYLVLVYARRIMVKVGPKGIDAVTRIVGFFVSAMGMGLVFHGIVDALRLYGVIAPK